MRILTFKGGIHLSEEKDHTCHKQIETIKPKPGSEMIFPMVQHIGAPCDPVVAKGDRVLVGQKIGEAKGFVSVPVHSSVSGTVKEIRPTLTPGGATCNAVVIENDGNDEQYPALKPNSDYKSFSREKLLELIKEAGVVGMGGAGFPTHIKLNPPAEKKIDTVIVNAAECEPFITADHRVMLEETQRLVRGLEIILSLHPGAKGIIAIETNKPDAIKALEAEAANSSQIEVVGLVPKYPQGSEKQLILACTNREVPSGGLPADVGCIVNNVDTVVAVERAIVRGRPLIRRVTTLTGGAVANPGNYKIKLGMTVRDFIEAVGGFKSEPAKVISGGPMMGTSMFTLDVPLIKTSSAILCLTQAEAEIPEEQNCIRCGRCVDNCPVGLMPFELNYYAINHKLEEFDKINGVDCIECGSCSYVCPAKRHLTQSIRSSKKDTIAWKRSVAK